MNSSTVCQTRFCLLHSRLVLWRSRSSTTPAVVRARSPVSDFLYPLPSFPIAAIIKWKNTRKNQHVRRRGPKHENRIPDPSVDGGPPLAPPRLYRKFGYDLKSGCQGVGGWNNGGVCLRVVRTRRVCRRINCAHFLARRQARRLAFA